MQVRYCQRGVYAAATIVAAVAAVATAGAVARCRDVDGGKNNKRDCAKYGRKEDVSDDHDGPTDKAAARHWRRWEVDGCSSGVRMCAVQRQCVQTCRQCVYRNEVQSNVYRNEVQSPYCIDPTLHSWSFFRRESGILHRCGAVARTMICGSHK